MGQPNILVILICTTILHSKFQAILKGFSRIRLLFSNLKRHCENQIKLLSWSTRCVTNFQSYCPDGSSRTFENSRTRPAGPDQYRTPKVVAVKISSLLSHLCYQAIEASYTSCHMPVRHKTNALTLIS